MGLDIVFKIKKAWEKFSKTHPQFLGFLEDVSKHGVVEGTTLTLAVRYPDGTEKATDLRVEAPDLDLIKILQEL